MATPVIAAVSEQDITIDTDYSLRVGITNDPEEVTVDGLLEGFAYDWHEDDDEVEIFGEATRLLGDAMWIVSAKETPTSDAVTREIIYNVVPTAPIIEEVGEQTIIKGRAQDIFVEVQNTPTLIAVDGLLTGLKHERDTDGEGEDAVDGVRITGTILDDVNLTIDASSFEVVTSNDGGEDTYNIPISILPRQLGFISDRDSTALGRQTGALVSIDFDADDGASVAAEKQFGILGANVVNHNPKFTASSQDLFFFEFATIGNNRFMHRTDKTKKIGDSIVSTKRVFVNPLTNFTQQLSAVDPDGNTCYTSDGTDIHVYDISDNFYFEESNGKSPDRSFLYPSGTVTGTISDLYVYGSEVYALRALNPNDFTETQIIRFSKETADNARAVITHSYTLPSLHNTPAISIAVDETYVYYLVGEVVRRFLRSSGDGDTVTIERQFNAPTQADSSRHLALIGNDLYASTDSSNSGNNNYDIVKFDKNTTGGTTATQTETFKTPFFGGFSSMSSDDTHIYAYDPEENFIYVFNRQTENNTFGDFERRFTPPSIDGGLGQLDANPIQIAIDDDDVYAMYIEVGVSDHTWFATFDKNTANNQTATITRRFRWSRSVTNNNFMVIVEDDIVFDWREEGRVYRKPKNTANELAEDNTTRFLLPASYQDVALGGATVYGDHLIFGRNNTLVFIDKDTEAGTTATVAKTISISDNVNIGAVTV